MRAFALAFLPLLACSPALTDEPGPHTQAAGKIYGGDAPDAAEHDAVVGLHEYYAGTLVNYPFCTGTLIDNDIVVTAAHCLETWTGGGVGPMDPSNLRIFVGDNPYLELASSNYEVLEVDYHPDYDAFRILNDIGIIRLADDVADDAGVTPVPNLPSAEGFTAADVGMTMNIAGFGYTESGGYGVKYQADTTLGGLGCAVAGCYGTDDPATQISYDASGGVGICSGDSGGPVFIERDGTLYTAGAHSYTDYWCEQYGVSTRVDAFEGWISDFVDGGAGDTGDTGGAGPWCGDGTCDPGESCDGRGVTELCPDDCDGRSFGPPFVRFCEIGPNCIGPACP